MGCEMGSRLKLTITAVCIAASFLAASQRPATPFMTALNASMSQTKVSILANEKILEYRFSDGAQIKVHYTNNASDKSFVSDAFARQTLDAAVLAYQEITQFKGFSASGYSFMNPDKDYAYDPDGVIDIYLAYPEDAQAAGTAGAHPMSFKEAPCFDTLRISKTGYQAMILLPSNYAEFIKNWERINPSSLGTRNIDVDLRGTLIHEMLHVVLFYYNSNLNKSFGSGGGLFSSAQTSSLGKTDWYVEGLARYFETFAGARHDFFSQGFKQTLPDKIRFSRGGSNYFMRYPDQIFTDLRYENALFWRFIDDRFGMSSIERLSRELRGGSQNNFKAALEKVTGVSFKELLKDFATAILFKDFGLKDDSKYLKDVAMTRLLYQNENLYLKDGSAKATFLGKTCKTDWIGRWDNAQASFGALPIAGDNTAKCDVSGWATDFYQIELDEKSPSLPWVGIAHQKGGLGLVAQVAILSKGGSHLIKEIGDIPRSQIRGMDLKAVLGKEGLSANDIDKIYLLITNMDPAITSDYEILVHSSSE